MNALLRSFAVTGVLLALAGTALDSEANPATLRAKYGELRGRLEANPFGRPLHLESSESAQGVAGDIHALVDYRFATSAAALSRPNDWCDILMLHINTKYCRVSPDGGLLDVRIGKKGEQILDEAYRVDFAHRVVSQSADYLKVTLDAERGPLGTRDYRILLEAVPLDDGRTFLHLSYTYAFGPAGRLAMQAYLGTTGRSKVGFTVAGKQADGQPLHVSGVRGVVERNTMRYYLAIDACLASLAAPPQQRLEKRLRDWFEATERYPRQLHEMERGEYLDMKRKEHQRSRT